MNDSLYYEFEIQIHRIYVDIPIPCSLQIRWKKGKNQSTSNHHKITNSISYIDINDYVCIQAKCKVVNGRFMPQ